MENTRLISTTTYPTTNNQRVVLDPYICSGTAKIMHVQCVHETHNGFRGRILGHLYKSLTSYKWVAVVYRKGKNKSSKPFATKNEAIAVFEKLV